VTAVLRKDALTQLQADFFVSIEKELALRAEAVVCVASVDDLVRP
jgi:hypothetical protein